MKCLSVRQPWAWLICGSDKDVENRTWETGYRGPLLIHASKNVEENEVYWLHDRMPDAPKEFAKGAIIGIATLANCTMVERSSWHAHGCVGWYLEDRFLFTNPIPWRGQLGLFDVPDAVVAEAIQRAKGGAA